MCERVDTIMTSRDTGNSLSVDVLLT